MREKYSFIGCHWKYGHSILGVSNSCKTLGKPRVLHDFDTPRVEWPYIQWQPMKESYSLYEVDAQDIFKTTQTVHTQFNNGVHKHV